MSLKSKQPCSPCQKTVDDEEWIQNKNRILSDLINVAPSPRYRALTPFVLSSSLVICVADTRMALDSGLVLYERLRTVLVPPIFSVVTTLGSTLC